MSRDALQRSQTLEQVPVEALCAEAVVRIFEGLHQFIIRLPFFAAAQRDAQPNKLRGLLSDLGDWARYLTWRRSDGSNLITWFPTSWAAQRREFGIES
jgi:hypothetical protein